MLVSFLLCSFLSALPNAEVSMVRFGQPNFYDPLNPTSLSTVVHTVNQQLPHQCYSSVDLRKNVQSLSNLFLQLVALKENDRCSKLYWETVECLQHLGNAATQTTSVLNRARGGREDYRMECDVAQFLTEVFLVQGPTLRVVSDLNVAMQKFAEETKSWGYFLGFLRPASGKLKTHFSCLEAELNWHS